MNTFIVNPSQLRGTVVAPPSKSHTLRALIFALMGNGTSVIRRYLHSPDTEAMIQAILQLGAQVKRYPDLLEVTGVGGQLQKGDLEVNAGNSGQVLRFIGALASLRDEKTYLVGDESITERRPMKPLLSALTQLGARTHEKPFCIQGPIQGGSAALEGVDSQPVSALLIAASFLPNATTLHVDQPGEKPWIDLTLHWLRYLNIDVENRDYTYYVVKGNAAYEGFDRVIPGDWSSAAYPIAVAAITSSEVTIENVDIADVQGDKKWVQIMQKMGAYIETDAGNRQLYVKGKTPLRGISIDMNDCIDMVTLLPVVASYAQTPTQIRGVRGARFKECDRIRAITTELKKMGAIIEEHDEGMDIFPSQLQGAQLETYADHRMVLALTVAGLAATGESQIHGTQVIAKSYPTFQQDFVRLGAQIC